MRISTVVLAVALAGLPFMAGAAQEQMGASHSKSYSSESGQHQKQVSRSHATMTSERRSTSRELASERKSTPARRMFTAKYEGKEKTSAETTKKHVAAKSTKTTRRSVRSEERTAMSCPSGTCPFAARMQTSEREMTRTYRGERQMRMARAETRPGARMMMAQRGMQMQQAPQFAYTGMYGGQCMGGCPQSYFTGAYGGCAESCFYSCPGRIVYGNPGDWCNMSYDCW